MNSCWAQTRPLSVRYRVQLHRFCSTFRNSSPTRAAGREGLLGADDSKNAKNVFRGHVHYKRILPIFGLRVRVRLNTTPPLQPVGSDGVAARSCLGKSLGTIPIVSEQCRYLTMLSELDGFSSSHSLHVVVAGCEQDAEEKSDLREISEANDTNEHAESHAVKLEQKILFKPFTGKGEAVTQSGNLQGLGSHAALGNQPSTTVRPHSASCVALEHDIEIHINMPTDLDSKASNEGSLELDGWKLDRNLWRWQTQEDLVIAFQSAPKALAMMPSMTIHFFFKRDWGMALAPLLAYSFAPPVTHDLTLSAMLAGVVCGTCKHVLRSPRPFWISQSVHLKQDVDEMSWGTPSAHCAIAAATSTCLITHLQGPVAWTSGVLAILMTMASRLYLAVHWPQDVIVGGVVGICTGVVVPLSGLHAALVYQAEQDHFWGAALYLLVGVVYFIVASMAVLLTAFLSRTQPLPESARSWYRMRVAAGVLRLLESTACRTPTSDAAVAARLKLDPDQKKRFWYNAANGLGVYSGLAMFAATARDESEPLFDARARAPHIAALFACSGTLSAILYTRSHLRKLLSPPQFEIARTCVYWLCGFYLYGLYPYLFRALVSECQ